MAGGKISARCRPRKKVAGAVRRGRCIQQNGQISTGQFAGRRNQNDRFQGVNFDINLDQVCAAVGRVGDYQKVLAGLAHRCQKRVRRANNLAVLSLPFCRKWPLTRPDSSQNDGRFGAGNFLRRQKFGEWRGFVFRNQHAAGGRAAICQVIDCQRVSACRADRWRHRILTGNKRAACGRPQKTKARPRARARRRQFDRRLRTGNRPGHKNQCNRRLRVFGNGRRSRSRAAVRLVGGCQKIVAGGRNGRRKRRLAALELAIRGLPDESKIVADGRNISSQLAGRVGAGDDITS